MGTDSAVSPHRVAQVVTGRFHLAIDAALVAQAVPGPLALLPLPRLPKHVAGAVDVRGAMVPVFDLAALLDPGTAALEATTVPMVLLIQHRDGRFALPIDALSGMRTVTADQLTPLDVQSPTGAGVFTQLLAADALHAPAVVLDLETLLRLENLHVAIAPPLNEDAEREAARDRSRTTCLAVRAGGVVFALPTSIVRHVEVRDRTVERSFEHPVLRGFRDALGELHAVVDLLPLLGLSDSTAPEAGSQLVTIGGADGELIALTVDQLLGLERVEFSALQPPVGLDITDPSVCCGTFESPTHGAVLVLDAAALLQAARIIDVSALLGAASSAQETDRDDDATVYMVYGAAGGLLTSPTTELAAVSTLPRDFTDLRHDGARTIGLMTYGGRPVPVADLSVLLGKAPLSDPMGCPVLLVSGEQGLVAFAVERVLFMRQARPQRIPHMATRVNGMVPAFTAAIIVDDAGVERSAAVLDLAQLARQIEAVSAPAIAENSAAA